MDLNNENEKKNNQSNIIIAILLIVAIIAVILTALYFKNSNNKENEKTPTNSPSPSNEPTSSPVPTTLSNEELTKYLTNVPMLLEYDIEKQYHDYNLDAYTGSSVTTNDLSSKLLLAMAYYKTEKEYIKDPTCTGNLCSGKEAMTVESIKNTVRKLYNISANAEESFPIIGGIVTKNGEEYNATATRGSSNYTKVLSNIKNYKIENNTLTITEEAAFMASGIDMDGKIYLFKHTNTSESLGQFASKDEILAYLNSNPSSIATFKHTFKYGNDKSFYYYSTEEVK